MFPAKKFIIFVASLRGGAVVARWAHNPKAVGSNPSPATRKTLMLRRRGFLGNLIVQPDLKANIIGLRLLYPELEKIFLFKLRYMS